MFGAQVIAASLLLGALLSWFSTHFSWISMGDAGGARAALLAACMAAAALLYFGVLRLAGLRVGVLARR
jgi:putative peptidoglycan lipid II flippase